MSKTEETPQVVNETSIDFAKASKFVGENQKSLLFIGGAIVAMIFVYFAYQKFYIGPREEEKEGGYIYCFLFGRLTKDACDDGFVVKDFGQWKVHEWGIAGMDLYNGPWMPYDISKSSVMSKFQNWPEHMKEKPWVDMGSFNKAFIFAREYYKNG